MSATHSQAPEKYLSMLQVGASPRDIFMAARSDGLKNFECTLIVAGLFQLELHEARKIAHAIYSESGAAAGGAQRRPASET